MGLFDADGPSVVITRNHGRITKCLIVDQKAKTLAELPISGFGYMESFGPDRQHSISLNVYSERVKFEEEEDDS